MAEVTPIWQLDPKWKNVKIGQSNVTVGGFGCTISSCCMALQKLRGWFANPGDAAQYWAFTLKGEIIWRECPFNGMKFIWRGYSPDLDKVAEYANSETKAAILEVNHGAHWVYLEKYADNRLHIIDPIDGKKYASLPSKYKFTGYALFEKAPVDMADWQKEALEDAKEYITKPEESPFTAEQTAWLAKVFEQFRDTL